MNVIKKHSRDSKKFSACTSPQKSSNTFISYKQSEIVGDNLSIPNSSLFVSRSGKKSKDKPQRNSISGQLRAQISANPQTHTKDHYISASFIQGSKAGTKGAKILAPPKKFQDSFTLPLSKQARGRNTLPPKGAQPIIRINNADSEEGTQIEEKGDISPNNPFGMCQNSNSQS